MAESNVQAAVRSAIGNRRRVPAAQLRNITIAFGAKLCRTCDRVLDISCFGPHTRSADGLSAVCNSCRKAYRDKNKDQANADRTLRYFANIDIERLRVKEWRLRNKDIARRSSKSWRLANPDAQKQAEKRWRENNPYKYTAIVAKRRAAKQSRTPAWLTSTHLAAINAVYKHAAELTKVTGIVWHVDHIIPLQGKTVSGLHVPWNLQLLPATENIKKGNRYGGE